MNLNTALGKILDELCNLRRGNTDLLGIIRPFKGNFIVTVNKITTIYLLTAYPRRLFFNFFLVKINLRKYECRAAKDNGNSPAGCKFKFQRDRLFFTDGQIIIRRL